MFYVSKQDQKTLAGSMRILNIHQKLQHLHYILTKIMIMHIQALLKNTSKDSFLWETAYLQFFQDFQKIAALLFHLLGTGHLEC